MSVKIKRIFFSLSSITDDGITTLRKLNVQKIFDLRSNPEVNKLGIK